MKVYIAGPLFNDMERERNRAVRDYLQTLGFETFLPQEDGSIAFKEILEGADRGTARANVFAKDMEEVKKCDIILCLLDGRTPDEGMCIELGAGHAFGKTCIGYLTDQRSFDIHGLNPMIEGCLSGVARSLEELKGLLSAG